MVAMWVKNEILWLNTLQSRKGEYEIQQTLPYFDLKENHLKNLRILPDREALLARMPKQAVVAELGVDVGDFSTLILSICCPQKLHLIDYWGNEKYNEDKMNIAIKKVEKKIKKNCVFIHRGLSFSELDKFEDKYFDWVYIDTDHSYETTKRELIVCSKKVKDSGLIAGHDYVTKCYRTNIRYGVVEAVNEFCYKENWEFIYLTHETNRHLSFAIKKI